MNFKLRNTRRHYICMLWGMTALILILVPLTNAESTAEIRLDSKMGEVFTESGFEVFEVCKVAHLACGIEEDVLHRIPHNRGDFKFSSKSLRNNLNAIAARYGPYRWVIRNNIVNFEPISKSGADPLSTTIDHINIQSVQSMSAVMAVLRQAKIDANVSIVGSPQYAIVNLDLTHATVRDALNAIAKQDGQVTWFFRPSSTPRGHASFSLSSWRTAGVNSH